eukprot:3939381-Rhodomonas_salina.2
MSLEPAGGEHCELQEDKGVSDSDAEGVTSADDNSTCVPSKRVKKAKGKVKKCKRRKEEECESDDNIGDVDGGEDEFVIPLTARYLSFLCFRRSVAGSDGWNTVFAQDMWDQFHAWARRNNFKSKSTAAEFAQELTRYAKLPDSGIEKRRQGSDLVISLHLTRLKECLTAQGLLDTDVW